MSQHSRIDPRPWRLRTIFFALFAGLSVFLLENLADPFVQRDANNEQLWGNTTVAIVFAAISMLIIAAFVVRIVRSGTWEKGFKKGGFAIYTPIQYGIVYLLGAAMACGLIYLTR